MDTLKIGYVTKKFPRFSETFIVHEILGLEASGVDITVFSRRLPDEGRYHPAVANLKNAVRHLSDGRSDALGQALAQHGRLLDDCLDGIPAALRWLHGHAFVQPLSILAESLQTIAAARALGIQHLHAHFATDAAAVVRIVHMLSGIPYSFTAHAKDLYREGVNPQVFHDKINDAAFVITVCDANVEFIRSRFARNSKTPVIRLYNGINLQFFAPSGVESTQGSRRNDRRVAAVGRLVRKKGFEVLIDAADLLARRGRPVSVDIVGDGELSAALRERAARSAAGDFIHFSGAITQPHVLEYLRRASVGCLPCVVDDDGNRDALPTSLIESMATGLPLISTPVGGVPEIVVNGETGWLVEPGSSEALAGAIEEALSNPREAARRGEAGFQRAQELFDVRKNTARLRELFAMSARREPIR